jgi:hypothetical protein
VRAAVHLEEVDSIEHVTRRLERLRGSVDADHATARSHGGAMQRFEPA